MSSFPYGSRGDSSVGGCGVHRDERGLRARLTALVVFPIVVLVIAVLVSGHLLKQAAIAEKFGDLEAMAEHQALLVSVAADFPRHASDHVRSHPTGVALDRIRDAYRKTNALPHTAELDVVWMEGDRIEVIARHSRAGTTETLLDESSLREPARRACAGKSGTISCRNQRGEAILTAYRAIPNSGVVSFASVALADVQHPFSRMSGIVGGFSVVLIIGSVALLYRVGLPLVDAVEQSNVELRTANNALHASERRFRDFLNHLGDAAYMLDVDGRLTYVNRFGGELIDLPIAQIIGQSFKSFLAEESLPIAWSAFGETLAGRTSDFEAILFNGKTVHVRVEPHFDAEKRIVGAVGIARDVTERERAGRLLRESEARFRSLAETNPVGVYVTDAEGRNRYVNPTICALTGLSPDEHRDAGWEKAIHPDDIDGLRERWRTAITNGQDLEDIHRIRRGDGQIVWVLSRAVPLRDESGTITGFVGTATDVTAQKQAEVLLRHSEQFTRSTLDALDSHIAIVNASGHVESVNAAWRRFAEQNALREYDVCEGANYLAVCESAEGPDADEARTFAAAVRDVLDGKRDAYLQEYSCHSPLEQRWFVARVTRFPGAGAARAVIAHENITDRKRVEIALRQQEHLLSYIITNIPYYIFWKDRESCYLGCNALFAEAAGIPNCDDIVGKNDFDLGWSREESEWYRKCDQEVMSAGKPLVNIEESQRRPDGTVATLLTSKVPMRDAAGEVTGILGIFTDITERKQAEEQSRLQSTALAAAVNAIVITDCDGTIVWANPAFAAQTGYSVKEAIGCNSNLLKSGKHDARFYENLWSTVRSGLPWHGELINRRKDGSLYPEDMTITPVRSETGDITHFVAIKQDISERRRAEAALANVQEQLVVASRHAGMSEVATAVLHNVGNVLNSVNVSAGIAREQLAHSKLPSLVKAADLIATHADDLAAFFSSDDRGKQLPAFLELVASHLSREQASVLSELTSLTQNIDHIKQIISRQQSYATSAGIFERVQLNDVVEDALRIDANAIQRHGIAVRKEFGEIEPIEMDRQKVLQILVNLIKNARQAMAACADGSARLTMRTSMTGAVVRVEVSDAGVGIPTDLLANIFSYGFTTKKDGHGFGLHYCAIAARELDGSLRAHSDGVNKGATFTLELPRNNQRVTGRQSAASECAVREVV